MKSFKKKGLGFQSLFCEIFRFEISDKVRELVV